MDFVRWFALIKLFDLGINARLAAREASVSYPTALNIFDCMRFRYFMNLPRQIRSLKVKSI